MHSVSVGIGYLANTLWMVAGMLLIAEKQISIGIFVGFISLSQEFSWPFNELSRLLAGLSRSKVSYERLYEPFPVIAPLPAIQKDPSADPLVRLCDAGFAYKPAHMVFDHVNLSVSQGEKIVIEGESGKGKSTLMKVIAGLYAPAKGTIFYKDPLSISYVPQDPSLFTGTILENIRMGNGCADKQAIEEAAEKAGLHEWIESLPHGYDTHLDVLGKQNLSQGQMQRIAIARALLRKADLYLFDEITSALDPVTENKILDTIESLDGAVLLISHKENVLARFDRKIRI